MKFFSIIVLTIIYLFAFTNNSYAYLDPGTGSMLLSALMGIVATLFFFIKSFYYKIKSFIFGLLGKKIKQTEPYGIVFYAEGKQYWNTFKPIIEELVRREIKCTYLTSAEDDEGLSYPSDLVDAKFIGTGNHAYLTLNMLEADIFALTTPGIGVLQIRRSPRVKHYAHIIHAPADIYVYKMYSFEYYDSFFASGDHQIKNIRSLESQRNTKAKEIYKVGVPYMDVLAEKLDAKRLEDEKTQQNKQVDNTELKKILIAPTWDLNGLLTKFGSKIIEPLLKQGFDVVVRPHPQSYVVEKDLIASIQEELKDYPNLTWDNSPDNFKSLSESDIMISDMSGVIFDYAFIFEKPVITIAFDPTWDQNEGYFLEGNPWEFGVLDTIGKQINIDDIENITEIVKDVESNKEKIKEDTIHLRNKSLFNYKNSGKVAVDTLLQIKENLK